MNTMLNINYDFAGVNLIDLLDKLISNNPGAMAKVITAQGGKGLPPNATLADLRVALHQLIAAKSNSTVTPIQGYKWLFTNVLHFWQPSMAGPYYAEIMDSAARVKSLDAYSKQYKR